MFCSFMALVCNLGFTLILLALNQSCFIVTFASSNVHIVYKGDRNRSHSEPQLVEDSHLDMLSRILGSKSAARKSILYSYKHGLPGFAAVLSQSQAKLIADFPGVVRVIPNKILGLHTTRSWGFLHVKQDIVTGVLSRGQSGRGTIIGIIDTGIWPESKSFKDEHMDNPPPHWRGICQGGENFDGSHCNSVLQWEQKDRECSTSAKNKADQKDVSKKENFSVSAMLASINENPDKAKKVPSSSSKPKPKSAPKAFTYNDDGSKDFKLETKLLICSAC